jgi:hypothetical protein
MSVTVKKLMTPTAITARLIPHTGTYPPVDFLVATDPICLNWWVMPWPVPNVIPEAAPMVPGIATA